MITIRTNQGHLLAVMGWTNIPLAYIVSACAWLDDKQAYDANVYVATLRQGELWITYRNGYKERLTYVKGIWELKA